MFAFKTDTHFEFASIKDDFGLLGGCNTAEIGRERLFKRSIESISLKERNGLCLKISKSLSDHLGKPG